MVNRMQQRFPPERREFVDSATGTPVTQWTVSPARSNHLYFTTPSVTADDRWLVFLSERLGSVNLFAAHRPGGEIHRVSDNNDGTQRSYCWPIGNRHGLIKSSPILDAEHSRLFYVQGDGLWVVELTDMERMTPQRVWTVPQGWWHAFNHVSPDGRTVCMPLADPRSFPDTLRSQGQQMQIGPRRMHASALRSRVYMIDVRTGQAEVVTEVPFWVTHVQFDPAGTGRVIFNQEGDRIDHHSRTWCLETDGSFRPLYDEPAGDWNTHENWSPDGSMIIYHGNRSGIPLIAARRWDGQLVFEWLLPDHPIGHTTPIVQANGFITDGGDTIALFTPGAGGEAPKRQVICAHGNVYGTDLTQDDHVHPLITPTGKSIIFSSTADGVANVYEVACPSVEALE